jgi:hypothetical protein
MSIEVLGISGSPVKKSNTDRLVTAKMVVAPYSNRLHVRIGAIGEA